MAVVDIEDQAFQDGFKGTDVVAEFCEFSLQRRRGEQQEFPRWRTRDADPDDPKSVRGVLHNPHSFTVKGSTSATGFNIGLARR